MDIVYELRNQGLERVAKLFPLEGTRQLGCAQNVTLHGFEQARFVNLLWFELQFCVECVEREDVAMRQVRYRRDDKLSFRDDRLRFSA